MNGHISTEAFQFPLYVNSSLSYGQHQVVLTNRGSKTFPFVDLDYVTITTGDQKSEYVMDTSTTTCILIIRQYRLRQYHSR
jgi:hypothetical protein